MKKPSKTLPFVLAMLLLAGCGESSTQSSDAIVVENDTAIFSETARQEDIPLQNDIGAMTPEQALEYMWQTENLVVVDVAAERWFEEDHFTGAWNIPIETLDNEAIQAMYLALPVGQPVLLHCRRGVIVPRAYQTVKELRPDIPEISYIDGAPLFEEYNAWVAENG